MIPKVLSPFHRKKEKCCESPHKRVKSFAEGGRSKLRIKIKSLAEEARIIRKEEKKHPGQSRARWELYWHRIYDLRRESRAAHLAVAYLQGRAYKEVEQSTRNPVGSYLAPRLDDLTRLIIKYGNVPQRYRTSIDHNVNDWLQGERSIFHMNRE